MECKLLGSDPAVWRAYLDICGVRRYGWPGAHPGPQNGIFVGGYHPERGPVLISGALHSPIDTRFVLLDHFVTNPSVPMKVRRDAAAITLRAAQTLATLMGRTVVIAPRASRSLRLFASRMGFKHDPQAMFCPPGVRVPWLLYQPLQLKEKAPKAPLPAGPQKQHREPWVPTKAKKRKGRR